MQPTIPPVRRTERRRHIERAFRAPAVGNGRKPDPIRRIRRAVPSKQVERDPNALAAAPAYCLIIDTKHVDREGQCDVGKER